MKHFHDLPGPRGLPIFGNVFQVRPARMHLQCEQWAREFGRLYRLQLGRRKVVVVADHKLVGEILRDRPDTFGRTDRLNQIWTEMGLPPGVFGANDDVWRKQRRMVMAGFDPTHVKRYFPALQGVASRLSQRWQKAATQNTPIDLQGDLMRYTVDTIAGLAFDAEVNTLQSDHDVIQRHLDQIFPALFNRVLAPFPIWRWWRSAANRRLEASLIEVLRAVNHFVAEARDRMATHPDLYHEPGNLLEAMLAAADEPDSGMDDEQVAGNVLTMLLAGEDTTANTLAWMIYLLWSNPQTLAQATAEVRKVCQPGTVPTLEQLSRLDYVDACAHETMRLKPVAPILPLQVQREVVIGDLHLEPGVVVINLMRVDSVSDAHVPQAAAFQPERWLVEGDPERMAQAAKRISMPFGAGPRICPGRYLALLEMKMAIATLLNAFDMLSVGTADRHAPREHLSFTMTPVGLKMRLRVRAN